MVKTLIQSSLLLRKAPDRRRYHILHMAAHFISLLTLSFYFNFPVVMWPIYGPSISTTWSSDRYGSSATWLRLFHRFLQLLASFAVTVHHRLPRTTVDSVLVGKNQYIDWYRCAFNFQQKSRTRWFMAAHSSRTELLLRINRLSQHFTAPRVDEVQSYVYALCCFFHSCMYFIFTKMWPIWGSGRPLECDTCTVWTGNYP